MPTAPNGLYYEETGSGEPLILLHSWGLSCRFWDDQIDAFAAHYRVIAYDQRNFGQSLARKQPFSDVEDLHGLLAALGIERAYLLGLSIGGQIAIDFTLEHPAMVKALLLAGPGLGGYQVSEARAKRIEPINAGFIADDMEATIEAMLNDPVLSPRHPQAKDRYRQIMRDNAHIWQPPYVQPGSPLEPPAIGRLGEIECPTLVIAAEHDDSDNLAIGELVAAGVRNARRAHIAGAAHLMNMDQPEIFNQIALDFLRQH